MIVDQRVDPITSLNEDTSGLISSRAEDRRAGVVIHHEGGRGEFDEEFWRKCGRFENRVALVRGLIEKMNQKIQKFELKRKLLACVPFQRWELRASHL